MARPLLVDLYCGAGGCSMGYHRAGFDVIGVDLAPQPRYPFDFIQADALAFEIPPEAVVVHASPPCQHASALRALWPDRDYPNLIPATREKLREWGGLYVIANVIGAELLAPVLLCGSRFGLDVRRHRLFECNLALLVPPCAHGWQTPRFRNTGRRRRAVMSSVVGVYGGSHFVGDDLGYRSAAMGIDWMGLAELSQAIPPAFTEVIGHQLIAAARDHGRACGAEC